MISKRSILHFAIGQHTGACPAADCFIDLPMDDEVWVPSVFSKNRERLIEHDAVI